MNKPCLRCVVLYILSLPPILALVMFRKIKDDVRLNDALDGLRDQLEALVAAGEELERMKGKKP